MIRSAALTSSIFDGVTGETKALSNGALRTARRIEEELITGRWPAGTVYGSQQEMLERYSVGRGVLREALRVLQQRGWANVRRGPGGGMIVSVPVDTDVIQSAIAYFIMVGITAEQVREARRSVTAMAARLAANCRLPAYLERLREIMAGRDHADGEANSRKFVELRIAMADIPGNPAILLLVKCMEQFFELASQRRTGRHPTPLTSSDAAMSRLMTAINMGDADLAAHLACNLLDQNDQLYTTVVGADLLEVDAPAGVTGLLSGHTRAGQVARNLIGDMRNATFQIGDRIGSEAELSRRYSVDRLVARQAIRILEDFGVVRAQRGRGRGLIAEKPVAGPTIRLISGYFSGANLELLSGLESSQIMALTIVRMAAEKADVEDCQRLVGVLKELAVWPGPAVMVPLNGAESEPARIARNPVLDVFNRSLQIFSLRVQVQQIHFDDDYLPLYRQHTRAVLEAIMNNNPAAAVEAQLAKHVFFRSRITAVREVASPSNAP